MIVCRNELDYLNLQRQFKIENKKQKFERKENGNIQGRFGMMRLKDFGVEFPVIEVLRQTR